MTILSYILAKSEGRSFSKMNYTNDILFQALRSLLQPLMPLLIRRNVTLQNFIDLAKELYVRSAEEGLKHDLTKATDSHISLITGVHRKDVKKYRRKPPLADASPGHLSHGAELLAIWIGNKKFLDAHGKPLPLPYMDKKNPGFSFSAIAESISKDIRARALLNEFVRVGIAAYDKAKNLVTLKADAFVNRNGADEKIYFLGRHGGDHIAAAVNNILSDKPRFFDRAVYYDGMTLESILDLRKTSAENAMKMILAINQRAFELSEKDKDRPDASWRFSLGGYFFTDAPLSAKGEAEE